MTTKYLLIRKKTGKNPVNAVRLKPGVSSKRAILVARKSLRPGLATAGVVSSLQLRRLIIKLRPKTKRATNKRKTKRTISKRKTIRRKK